MTLRPGVTNSLTDVPGFRVGQVTRRDQGWLTGTTVVLAPEGGAVGGVDVRGGAPGTRETDLLDPRNLVDRVDAVVLTGGSAFGLAATDGVMAQLHAAGNGWPVGPPAEVVPIVPAAVVYDLGRGGVVMRVPSAADGAAAARAASTDAVEQGNVGAGTGARAGGFKGGVGSASVVLPDGTTVAALVVVNSFGDPCDPATGELYARRHGLEGEFASVGVPDPAEVEQARRRALALDPDAPLRPGLATVIGVVATDAELTKAQCQKVSGLAHDGLARAVDPVHTMLDGDALFTLARPVTMPATMPATMPVTGPADLPALHAVMLAASSCVTRAVGHAVLAAESVLNDAVDLRSYRDAFPSAFRA